MEISISCIPGGSPPSPRSGHSPRGASCGIGARRAWARVIDPDLLPALRLPGAGGGSPWRLLVAAWTVAVLALAGMTWERDQSVGYHAPSDWILVLDLSPSMAATDVPPDRATRARYVISDFLNAAQDTRVALVVFAGEAHTVTPLTTDVETVRALLPALAPEHHARIGR